MPTELEDLVEFLGDPRLEVKGVALGIVEGLSGSADGIAQLKAVQPPLVRKLFGLAADKPEVSRKALGALVNLSQDAAVAEALLKLGAINRVMDYIRDGTSPHADLLVMLLANLTTTDEGSKDMLQIGRGPMEGLHMAVLLKKFVVGGMTLLEGEADPYEHVASVLTNVTRLPEARRLLLQPGRGLLQALVSQLQSWNSLRRLGASGAIKNCAMAAEEDGTLGDMLQDTVALGHLLRPINGQPPLEPEATVRECVAEAVLALARTDKGRDALWEAGAPEALRKGYEDEQHPGVCVAMEQTAEVFLSHGTIDSGTTSVLGMSSASAQQQQSAAASEPPSGS